MPAPLFNRTPILAFTAGFPDASARTDWVGENAYAVEFSPDPEQLDLLPQGVAPFLEAGLPVRFHTRYYRYEIGHADAAHAHAALQVHMRTLESMAGLGEPVVTVHTGLDPDMPVSAERIVENLSRLVEYARRLGITVCLENLRRGHAADPWSVLEWATASGAMITLDLGHALGSESVQSGRCVVEDFVDLFGPWLVEAHIYGREDSRGHHPIVDMTPFEPVIEKLLWTGCPWWTVELQDPVQAMSTREKIEGALRAAFARGGRTGDGPKAAIRCTAGKGS